MDKRKTHFLIIWPIVRKDWVERFYHLNDEFQLTFLPSIYPVETNFANPLKCVYWSQFSNAEEILDELQPSALIFMSIDTGLSITLNHLAQKRGIKTLILQHGIYTNYRDYRLREKIWNLNKVKGPVIEKRAVADFSSSRFIWNSYRGPSTLNFLKILLYSFLKRYKGSYWTAKHFPLKMKRADQYLCFSPYNSTIHLELDRISQDRIRYIQSYELIKYLVREDKVNKEGKYYLHIDQALAENSLGEITISKDQMIEFYLKLNDFCLSKGAKLLVKLHPESYKTSWLPNHENILFLREVDTLNGYIQNAEGCFGFYSTLVLPAVYWRPTILFNLTYSGLQSALVQVANIQVLDFYKFEIDEIHFKSEVSKLVREEIKEMFLEPKNATSLSDILDSYATTN